MSFILDALKKAESERNRHIAPVLMDARVAPPRRGLPGWALLLGAVLVVNLGVLAWLLWRAPAAGALTAGAGAASAPAGASGPAVSQAPLPTPMPGPSQAPPPQSGTGMSQAPSPPPATATATTPMIAQPAPQPAAPSRLPPQSMGDLDSVPSLHALRAAGIALPDLQLNLHVYDPAPAHRSVLLNGNRLREGEYTPDGVKVERITPTGVVLEAAGRRFGIEVGL